MTFDDEQLKRDINWKLRHVKHSHEVDPRHEVKYVDAEDSDGVRWLGIKIRLRPKRDDDKPPIWLRR